MNQDGERLRGFDVNTLTVVATESYEQFAENLQKEIETETRHSLRHRREAPVRRYPGSRRRRVAPWRWDSSSPRRSGTHLQQTGLVDATGKVQDSLRRALKEGTLALPEALAASFLR